MKTCNGGGFCSYNIINGCLTECSYEGYCDHQRPIDSRQPDPIGIELSYCICGSPATTGGKCSVCGKDKYTGR